MKYWTIDKETREVVGSGDASKWNVPRHVLLVEPIPAKVGFAVVAKPDMQSTKYVVDHRGKTMYSIDEPNKSQIVGNLGELDEGWTLKKRPSPYHSFNDAIGDWELTSSSAQKQLADTRQLSINQVDEVAAQVIAKWSRFAEEYKERELAASAYQAANYSGYVSIYISSFADSAGLDYVSATDLILKQANGLRTLQEKLAIERMRKYELKQTDLTLKQIDMLRDDIISNIKTLGESYE